MKVWESGRESTLLDEIISGRKTIEGRLNRGKFSQYSPGHMVRLRRDTRDSSGVLCNGDEMTTVVKVLAIRHYSSFRSMVQAEGYTRVIPTAANEDVAIHEYDKYYTHAEQKRYGVLAIEIEVA